MTSHLLLDQQVSRPWVFLDAGDTFVYGYPTFYAAVGDCWVALGESVDADSVKHSANRYFTANPRAALVSQESFQRYFEGLYRHVLTELNFPGPIEDNVASLWSEWESGHRLRLFDDALAALEMLKRARFKLGAVSNWDLSFDHTMDRLGVSRMFSVQVCSCAIGAAKPDPAIFEYALDRAGIGPSQAWFIGDQIDYDIEPARELGMKTICVDYYGKIKESDRRSADYYAPSLSLAAEWILQDELGGGLAALNGAET